MDVSFNPGKIDYSCINSGIIITTYLSQDISFTICNQHGYKPGIESILPEFCRFVQEKVSSTINIGKKVISGR